MTRDEERVKATALWMGRIKSLPRGFDAWAYKTMFSSERYLMVSIDGKKRTGTCKHCGWTGSTSAKVESNIMCPSCKTMSLAKSEVRCGRMVHSKVASVVQRIEGGIIVRTINVWLDFSKTPSKIITNELRRTIWPDDAKKPTKYAIEWGKGTWAQNPFVGDGWANHLHPCCKAALKHSRWKYSGLPEAGSKFPVPTEHFLKAYLKHPCLEMLSKLGMKMLLYQVIEAGVKPNSIDSDIKARLRSTDPEEVVGVPHRYWPIVIEANLGAGRIETLKKLLAMGYEPTVNDANAIFDDSWRSGEWAVELFGKYRMLNFRSTMDYLAKQSDKDRKDYLDYIIMVHALKLDARDADILRPKEFRAEHDRLAKRMDSTKQARNIEGVKRAALANHALEIAMNGMITRVPSDPAEIVQEGQALHHCVGSYAERVAKGECLIVFIRKEASPDEPFVTVEIRNNAVIQVRGKNNAIPPPEVEKWIKTWTAEWSKPAKAARRAV
jgi:hypothetical protein